MAIYESWDPVAVRLGYANEAEMLKALYIDQKLSISSMVKKLGYAQNSIRTRLKELGVLLNPRGGPNAQGKTILKDLTNEELIKLKPSDLLTVTNSNGLRKYNCTPNTLYKEKIRRGLITPKESQPTCTTPVSPQPPILNNTPEEATSNSALLKSPCETLLTSNGIDDEESLEISSSSITEPTKES